jgi:dTDP-4-amino-4,6-dideoxygalactose transaminase
MLVTDDPELARHAKHLTTPAKRLHPWEFVHDEIGFNYRLPNLNAALGLAQMEMLPTFLEKKRELAESYRQFFDKTCIDFAREPKGSVSNYWLNSILLDNRIQRDALLSATNSSGIMTRPLWRPMHMLDIYQYCQRTPLRNTELLYDRLVSLPSSVRL